MNDHGLTCTHRLAVGYLGLCPACQEEYDANALAYAEYGHHPEGERRYPQTAGGVRPRRRVCIHPRTACPPPVTLTFRTRSRP